MSALETITTRLVYTEDQALLRDEVRRFLQARSSMESIRRASRGPEGFDSSVWSELATMGWLGLVTPQEHGGVGLGAVELAILCEEAGRTLFPMPLLAHLLATKVVDFGGSTTQRAALLPKMASGNVRAAWAHVDRRGSWRVADTTVEADGDRLYGVKGFVWGAETADLFCIPARVDEEVRIAVVRRDAPGVEVTGESVLDRTRRQGRITLEGAVPEMRLERPAGEVEERLLPLAWMALSAESVGGANAALDMTAAYAATREQFGKPIGAFQAIKHPLVNVLIEIEQARSLTYASACATDAGNADAVLLGRMAKVVSSDAYNFATSRAIQFHGGFGFTEECDAHLFRRRALASRPAFGDADHHRQQIADAVLG